MTLLLWDCALFECKSQSFNFSSFVECGISQRATWMAVAFYEWALACTPSACSFSKCKGITGNSCTRDGERDASLSWFSPPACCRCLLRDEEDINSWGRCCEEVGRLSQCLEERCRRHLRRSRTRNKEWRVMSFLDRAWNIELFLSSKDIREII